jgi:hypothetical protein
MDRSARDWYALQPAPGFRVLSDVKHAFSALALCAALAAAIAGCQDSQSGSAGAPSSATAAASPGGQAASAVRSSAPAWPATAPRTAAAATPSASASPADTAAPAAAAPTATALAGVGVVSACDDAPPHSLSREPSVIILACADAGIGVQDLTWTSWTASSATGQGVLWENECVPTASCGANKFSHYPVAVTLSVVKASAAGAWFSQLKVTWKDGRPPNQTPDTFILQRPG